MTRYFYDCRYVEDGRTIDLISIGIVTEDGREYYAQSAEFLEHGKPTPYAEQCIIPHLGTEWTERAVMREQITAFMDISQYRLNELWGFFCAHQYVAFCQIFGTMMDTPPGFPMYTHDIRQWRSALGDPQFRFEAVKGNDHALNNARWYKHAWEFLKDLSK